MLKHLPNALTLLRLILAPIVAWAVWQAMVVADATSPEIGKLSNADVWALVAALLFVIAALTDLFDGLAARLLKAESKFGRVIDPIADKALVGLPLITASVAFWPTPFALIVAIPTGVIALRDVLITVLRLTAPDGEGVKVSQLAKWKTGVELAAVGLLVLFIAVSPIMRFLGLGENSAVGQTVFYIWIGLLVLAALLSTITAIQYLTERPARA